MATVRNAGRSKAPAALLALFLAALCGCAGLRAGEAAGKGPSGAGFPEELVARFIEALNTCDLQGTMRLFDEEATAFLPLDGIVTRVEGRKAIEEAFAAFYMDVRASGKGPRYMNIEPQSLKFQRSGKSAVATFQVAKGPVTSRRSFVLRRTKGRWLIIHLHASNIRKEG